MNKRKFLNAIQQFTARVAVSASAPTKGPGSGGVVETARKFLGGRRMHLATFGTSDPQAFKRGLDRTTRQLRDALPKRLTEDTRWALSRKLLNIFLRDCFYTTYLAEEYKLHEAEELFEIPLDLNTANQIRNLVPELPRWKGVWKLTPEVSLKYQDAAKRIVKSKDCGMARVHLDAYWWGRNER